MSTPILAMIPSGVKAAKLYSVLPTDGTGDFTVARAGLKHKVNSDLNLELIAATVPSLNYDAIGGCPVLNTEPQATNLITYPISYANPYWTKSGATIEGDATTVGADLISGWDFTNWSALAATPVSATSYTFVSINDWIRKSFNSVTGQTYKITITGTQSVGGSLHLNAFSGAGLGFPTITDVNFSQIFYTDFISSVSSALMLQTGTASNTVSLTTFTIQEVQGYSSPSVDFPTSAFKLVEDTSNGQHNILVFNAIGNGANTVSIYAKASDRSKIALYDYGYTLAYGSFDLSNGTILDSSVGTAKIDALANGWYRISITYTTVATNTIPKVLILPDSYTTGVVTGTYLGTGKGLYIFGAQLETGSVATSPTFTDITLAAEGSTTTRLADSVTGAGDATLFSGVNTSGVLYGYIASHETSNAVAAKAITISDGTTANRVLIGHNGATNQIFASINVGGAAQASFTYTVTDVKDYHKVAISFALNSFNFYVDGVLRGTDASGSVFGAGVLTGLQFTSGASSSQFYGKTKGIIVYDTELSGADMITLTTL